MDTSHRENYIVFVNPNQGRRTACCLRVLRRFPSSFFLRVFHDKGWYTRSVPWLPVISNQSSAWLRFQYFTANCFHLFYKKWNKNFCYVDAAIKSPERHRYTRPPSENFFVNFFFVVIGCKHWSHYVRSINSRLSSIGSDSAFYGFSSLKSRGVSRKLIHWRITEAIAL